MKLADQFVRREITGHKIAGHDDTHLCCCTSQLSIV